MEAGSLWTNIRYTHAAPHIAYTCYEQSVISEQATDIQYIATNSTLRTHPADHQEGLTQTGAHQTFHRYST